MTQFITTNLAMETKWGKEKSAHRMFRVDLFSVLDDDSSNGFPNDMIKYSICKPDENGKFTDQFSINLQNNYTAHYMAADEMLRRVSELLSGKHLESSPIVIDNSPRNYKDATKVITFDAYYNKEKNISTITVKLQRKEKAEDEKFETEVFYFGISKSIRRYNKEEKPVDFNVFQFFFKLKRVLQGLLDGTSMIRNVHYKKIEHNNNNKEDNYKNKSKTEKQAYTKDAKNKADDYEDDEFPF